MVGSKQIGSRRGVGSRIAGGLLALALVAAACGDDDGNGTDEPDPDAPPTEVPTNGDDPDDGDAGEPLDEAAATEAIVTAIDAFLGAESDEAALAWVVGGEDERFAEIFTEIQDRTRDLALPVESGNLDASFVGDDRANFTYDLVSSETGDVLVEDVAGDALLLDGTWLITATTVCDIGGLGAADLVGDCLARAAEAESAATA